MPIKSSKLFLFLPVKPGPEPDPDHHQKKLQQYHQQTRKVRIIQESIHFISNPFLHYVKHLANILNVKVDVLVNGTAEDLWGVL